MNSMERFRSRFGKERVVLPVIHLLDWEQAKRNVTLARAVGADGVWLISHGEVHPSVVIEWQKHLMESTGWDNIGVNLLGVDTADVFAQADAKGMGIWADNAGVTDENTSDAERINPYRKALVSGLYFGGVSFKYQAAVKNLAEVARAATAYVDVITTSGPGTGKAADKAKLATLREAVPNHPIALASGITPENAADYLPYVNALLVATGINRNNDFYNIEGAKLTALVQVVQAF